MSDDIDDPQYEWETDEWMQVCSFVLERRGYIRFDQAGSVHEVIGGRLSFGGELVRHEHEFLRLARGYWKGIHGAWPPYKWAFVTQGDNLKDCFCDPARQQKLLLAIDNYHTDREATP